MCIYCHQTPHDCRCPNAQPDVIGTCDFCGEVLTDAYEYYEDAEGNSFCSKECAVKYWGIREVQPDIWKGN